MALDDIADLIDGRIALERMSDSNEKTIPWEESKRRRQAARDVRKKAQSAEDI